MHLVPLRWHFVHVPNRPLSHLILLLLQLRHAACLAGGALLSDLCGDEGSSAILALAVLATYSCSLTSVIDGPDEHGT